MIPSFDATSVCHCPLGATRCVMVRLWSYMRVGVAPVSSNFLPTSLLSSSSWRKVCTASRALRLFCVDRAMLL